MNVYGLIGLKGHRKLVKVAHAAVLGACNVAAVVAAAFLWSVLLGLILFGRILLGRILLGLILFGRILFSQRHILFSQRHILFSQRHILFSLVIRKDLFPVIHELTVAVQIHLITDFVDAFSFLCTGNNIRDGIIK